MRHSPGPPRGLVTTGQAGATEHRRLLPCAELSAHIAHFWWVRWAVQKPVVVETLPHPTVHLTFQAPSWRGRLGRGAMGRFRKRLSGTGHVVGVKFRPAVFSAWAPGEVGIRPRSAAQLLGRLPHLTEPASLEEAMAVLEPALSARAAVLSPQVCEVRDLVERIEHDRQLTRVEQVASLAGLQVRTLQRRFERFTGYSVKWVINRYRLHEAMERLRSGQAKVAELAAELGYFDQAHFTRDFSAMIGRSPRAFAKRMAE